MNLSKIETAMKKTLLSLFVLLTCSSFILKAQQYEIKVSIPDYPGKRAYLALLQGDESILVDSTSVSNGRIDFWFDEENIPGMYRIFLSDPSLSQMRRREPVYFDFLFNRENIELMSSYSSLIEDMVVFKSEENKKYFDFLKLKSGYRRHLGLLLPLTDVYDSTDGFFVPLRKETLNIQLKYSDSLVKLADTNPQMLVSSLIALNKEPVYDPGKHEDLTIFMRKNYLATVSFTDERLLNTNAITQKIISYLSFYRGQDMNKQEQEKAFIRAVDKIMEEVSYNQEIYDFVLDYLIDGFEQFQMEEVLVHIADNYLTGECKTDSEEIAKERLEAYQRMAPGKKVPDINLLDPFDIPRRLSSLENDLILLIFWSSECPHCTNLLPRLNKWYNKEKENYDMGIYTVSIDKNRIEWEEFVLTNELEWINVHDPEGWESTTSQRYNIYATPTIFLLDSNLNILAKPITFKDIKQAIENVNL